MSGLRVLSCGPTVSVQDLGRFGYLEQGLSPSGAADNLALYEAQALLCENTVTTAVEMAGFGGQFQADVDMTIALTGAPMQADIDGNSIQWASTHLLKRGALLTIGGTKSGVYGYLSCAHGFAAKEVLGSRSVHLRSGVGRALQAGDILPITAPATDHTGRIMPSSQRYEGGEIRVMPTVQTDLFNEGERKRFQETDFIRSARANRMGVAFDFEGEGFATENQLSILSEIITIGDIQMTGDGRPFVLLPECQTTGGYPRIATVIPADMPKLVQTPTGSKIRFKMVSRDAAMAAQAIFEAEIKALSKKVIRAVRDPRDIADLGSYQLISGAISAHGADSIRGT